MATAVALALTMGACSAGTPTARKVSPPKARSTAPSSPGGTQGGGTQSGGIQGGGIQGGGTSTTLVTLHLGYFPNLTHATALAGMHEGIFAKALGPTVRLRTSTFNAGPAEVEALFSGALDAAYLGPNSAINAFSKSGGSAITVVSGATSGGAALVVKPSIGSAADLRGKRLATPQLGNTQDVALRTWLTSQGIKTDVQAGGDVSILPQDNAQALQAFEAGAIDGAWIPQPWATRLVQQGGGKVLVDEKTVWPGGKFASTLLAVRTEFAKKHPDTIKALLRGQVQANDLVNANPLQAQTDANAEIAASTGKPLDERVIAAAWPTLTFTDDPTASSLQESADHATAAGLLHKTDLKGLVDLTVLNQVLAAAKEPEVQGT